MESLRSRKGVGGPNNMMRHRLGRAETLTGRLAAMFDICNRGGFVDVRVGDIAHCGV